MYEKKANAQNKKRRTATRGRDYRRLCFVSLQVSSLPLYKALTSYGGSHPRKKPLSTRTGERSRERTQAMADDLFGMVTSGKVKIHVEQRYALDQVQQAHRDLEARKTTGSSVLLP